MKVIPHLEFNKYDLALGLIIRRENEYKDLDINIRRKIFNKMSFFVNHIEFKYATVIVEKKCFDQKIDLIGELSKQLGRIIRNNYQYFQSCSHQTGSTL